MHLANFVGTIPPVLSVDFLCALSVKDFARRAGKALTQRTQRKEEKDGEGRSRMISLKKKRESNE
jgi:hypothetical protein